MKHSSVEFDPDHPNQTAAQLQEQHRPGVGSRFQDTAALSMNRLNLYRIKR
jgi:hypothetical protein